MPQIVAEATVPVPPAIAFAVSQTTGAVRLSWDPFVRRQCFLDGAKHAAKDVRTFTKSRHGLTMISRYVSFSPPTNVGITMERGPWFLGRFAAGWRFAAYGDGTHAVWKYTFTVQPGWLRPSAIGSEAGCSAVTFSAASRRSRSPAKIQPFSRRSTSGDTVQLDGDCGCLGSGASSTDRFWRLRRFLVVWMPSAPVKIVWSCP